MTTSATNGVDRRPPPGEATLPADDPISSLSRDRRRRKARRRWPRVLGAATALGLLAFLVQFGILPAVHSARRQQCSENLKSLGLALIQYHDAYGSFPAPALTRKDGAVLLSWRVAILPELGYRDLYERFHRDEPWDSPHNLALLSEIPPAYVCPSESAHPPGRTGYQVVVGPKTELGSVNTPFEPGRGVDLREVTDGASSTLLVVETNALAPWTKPDDLRFVDGGPLPRLGSRHPGGSHALLVDGAVTFLRYTINPAILKAIFTINGGEVTSDA